MRLKTLPLFFVLLGWWWDIMQPCKKKKKEKKIGLHSPISRNTAIAILRMGTCGLLSTSKNALLKSGAKRPGKWFMLGSFIVVE